MPHESFFEATEIRFTYWENNSEKTLLKYNSFDDLPKHLANDIDEDVKEFTIRGKRWKIVEIDEDLRAHGKGIRIRIRLEKI